MATTLLRGGRVLCAASGLDQTADVLLAGGRVAAVSAKPGELAAGDATIVDCAGLLV